MVLSEALPALPSGASRSKPSKRRNVVVRMKKVSKRKAKSTIGVISRRTVGMRWEVRDLFEAMISAM